MIGIYPYVNGIGGVPLGHPGRWISGRLAAGMPLIVIDPRETNVAKRATIYLQPRPGHDVAILAAMIRVILAEGLHDADFVGDETRNVDVLRRAVHGFAPEEVASAAGVEADVIVRAARVFSGAGRGYAVLLRNDS